MSQTRHMIFVLTLVVMAASQSSAQEPKDRAAWAKQIEAALAAGKDKDAVALIAQAAKALPDDTHFQAPADWLSRYGAIGCCSSRAMGWLTRLDPVTLLDVDPESVYRRRPRPPVGLTLYAPQAR